jgi:molybdopterin-guanine dinucleotide biosynthesis protein B
LTPPRLAFVGPSGAGKTTALESVLAALAGRGHRIAVVKHTPHAHVLDRPGKDSFRLRRAGASAVAVWTAEECAVFLPPAADLDAVCACAHLADKDLILIEGGHEFDVPKIEVHRKLVSHRFICADDPRVVAVLSDERPPKDLPHFSPADPAALASWIERHFLAHAVAGAR